MMMGYYVEFRRTVYIDDEYDFGKDNPTKEDIISAAVDIWNEDLDLEDLMMDESNAINVMKD